MFRLVSLLVGFVFGSVPFAFIFTRLFSGKDIMNLGSGNPGTVNVLRSVGRLAGVLTFLCDLLKTAAAMLLMKSLFSTHAPTAALFAGFGAVLGHDFSPFLGFKGGKGIAVTIAASAIIDWRLTAALIPAALCVLLYKKMSLGSVAFAAALPFAALAFCGDTEYVLLFSALSLLIFIRHRVNFKITSGVQQIEKNE